MPWAKPIFFDREREYLADALDSTWISGGPYVERFEKDFAKAIKTPFVITASNGTTALLLAMLGLNINPGDEVIVPGFTFVAPANMAIAIGARPVFVDVDPLTWCIDPHEVQKAVTKKTKVICAVHLYGNVCAMNELQAICRKHKLILVEDVAEAAFSKYKGRFAGTLSDAGTFSFQATKTITMGEGGCVAVRDEKLAHRMRIIRSHGMNREKFYWHTEIGHNFRLPNLQAAVGCAQLERAHKIIAQKKCVYKLYKKYLKNINGVTLQYIPKEVDAVVWAVAVKIDPKAFRGNRDQLMTKMLEVGIETRPGFYPFEVMPLYKPFVNKKSSIARELGANVLSLPSFSQLTEEEIVFICQRLQSLRK